MPLFPSHRVLAFAPAFNTPGERHATDALQREVSALVRPLAKRSELVIVNSKVGAACADLTVVPALRVEIDKGTIRAGVTVRLPGSSGIYLHSAHKLLLRGDFVLS